ncbi:MAG: MarR family winged helix-turn-helix transcriptional regulator [Acidimicrobiales bacterium]
MATSDPVDDMLGAWRQARPDLDLEAMATFGRLGRIHLRTSRAIEAVFERHGLSTGEFDVLAALRRAGSPHALTPSELARALMLSPGGMTNRIDRLEEAGWVRRQPDADDRRSLAVILTPEGLALVDAAVTDHVANEADLLASLSGPQRRALDDALRTLLAALET